MGAAELIDTKAFATLLKEHFVPVLKKCGFKGSGKHYRTKPTSRYVHALVIQANRYGGSCCVEMGIYMEGLPVFPGTLIPAQKVTTYDCEFRQRLHNDRGYSWWEYGETESDAIRSIEDMKVAFLQNGLPYFEKFRDFPSPLSEITVDDLIQGRDNVKSLGLLTSARLALVLANVHLLEGNATRAAEFAQWGLNEISEKKYGSDVVPNFEEIIQRAD